VTSRDKVFLLSIQGCRLTEIAARLGVSKQRVHQILSDFPARPPGKPGRPPAPLEDIQPQFQPRQCFKAEQIPQVMEILKGRDSWTWVEAERELLKHSLRPAANKINVFLRDLDFQWDRRRRRWFRG